MTVQSRLQTKLNFRDPRHLLQQFKHCSLLVIKAIPCTTCVYEARRVLKYTELAAGRTGQTLPEYLTLTQQ